MVRPAGFSNRGPVEGADRPLLLPQAQSLKQAVFVSWGIALSILPGQPPPWGFLKPGTMVEAPSAGAPHWLSTQL